MNFHHGTVNMQVTTQLNIISSEKKKVALFGAILINTFYMSYLNT